MDRVVLEKMMAKAKSKLAFRDSLRCSSDYIDWLVKFTNNKGGFDTSVLLYKADKYSERDQDNIRNIETLYEVVSEFAKENYIVPNFVEYGYYYSIKYKDVGFYIGIDVGQGTSFYCTRLDEVEDNSLDYMDIVNNNKLPETERKERRLEELSLIIDSLFKEDHLPIELIEETAVNAIQKIKNKEQ